MRFPPLDEWLTWPSPNLVDPPKTGSALVICNVVFICLMISAVSLRLYSRIAINRQLGSDDAAIVVALFFAIALGATVVLANVSYGWDRHVWDMPFNLFKPASICAFVAKILFTMAATMTRISLILFFYRLVKDANTRYYRWVLHASIVWTVCVCITFVALTIWQCSPVQSYWVFPIMDGSKCLNEGTVTLAAGVINCISDLQVTLLPIPLIMRLQLPLKQRLGVTVLLSLGFIVTAAGIIRTYFIWKSLVDSWDETWLAYPLWISASVEIDLAVLCACAPSLKPLCTRFAQRISNSISSLRTPKHSANSSPDTSAHTHSSAVPVSAAQQRSMSSARRVRRKTPMSWLWANTTTLEDGDEIELVTSGSSAESHAEKTASIGKDDGVSVSADMRDGTGVSHAPNKDRTPV